MIGYRVPIDFYAWVGSQPEDYLSRRRAITSRNDDKTNQNNAGFMSQYAFQAGVRAGLEIASQRMKSVILGRALLEDEL